MTINVDLRLREILATVAGMSGVDGIYSDSTFATLGFDADSEIVFWREIEHEFGFVVTKAEKHNLAGNVGAIVQYIKLRLRADERNRRRLA